MPNIIAAWKAKNANAFLFTGIQKSYVCDIHGLKDLPGLIPCGIPQTIETHHHISTSFITGNGIQNTDNLQGTDGHSCQFEFAHPISDDGTAILTVENQTLNLWKKQNNQWIIKQHYPYEKIIQFAGFNDLNRSVIIKFCDKSSAHLTLALEALKL